MTEIIRTAVLHSKRRKLRKFPGEGVWAFIGILVGVLLPVRHWFGIDLKVWIVVLTAIAVLEILAANIAHKAAFPITPKRGWSIASIMVEVAATSDPKHKLLAFLAVGLSAKISLIGGIFAGQTIAIYVGLGAFHLNG